MIEETLQQNTIASPLEDALKNNEALCVHSSAEVNQDSQSFLKACQRDGRIIFQQILSAAHSKNADDAEALTADAYSRMLCSLKKDVFNGPHQPSPWERFYQHTIELCFSQLLNERQNQIGTAIQSALQKDKSEHGAAVLMIVEEVSSDLKEKLRRCDRRVIHEPQFWICLGNSTAAYCFELLFEAYRPQLKTFVLRLNWNADDADDIVQQAIMNAFRHLRTHGVPSKSSFDPKGWIFTITKNTCLKAMRTNRMWESKLSIDTLGREHPVLDIEDDSTADPHIALERAETRETLFALIHQLPAIQRDTIHLRFVEGLSYDEIARQLDCNPATVRSHARRGVQILKKQWETVKP